jgi:chloramphenicol O-acetyltransferase type B
LSGGDGAVIDTRAVITQNVEPFAIVGGNPATTIRTRFDAAEVELLLKMRWWDWPDD